MRSGLLMIGFLLCAGAGLADVSLLAVLAPGHFAVKAASPPPPLPLPLPRVAAEPPEPAEQPPAVVPQPSAVEPPVTNEREIEVAVEEQGAACVVYFASESVDVDAAGLEALHTFAATVGPDVRLRIEGHSDPSGSTHGHAYFSSERAHTVLKLLNSFGISRSLMTARGLGATRTLDAHPSAASLAQDRRVEIFIDRSAP